MAVESNKHPVHHWGAWVFIKWKAGAPEEAWAPWKKLGEIKEAWSMSGEWDCALWLELDNPESIEKLIWREIRKNQWVDKTETHWAKKFW